MDLGRHSAYRLPGFKIKRSWAPCGCPLTLQELLPHLLRQVKFRQAQDAGGDELIAAHAHAARNLCGNEDQACLVCEAVPIHFMVLGVNQP